MKLSHLNMTSFRSYRSVSIALDAPRVLIAGLNGSGKTSVREAIRWILTGRCAGTDGKGAGADVLIPQGLREVAADCVVAGVGRATRTYLEKGGGSFTVEGFTGTSQVQQQALLIKLQTSVPFLDAVLASEVFLDLGHVEAKALVLSLLGVSVNLQLEGADGPVIPCSLDELDARYKQAFEDRKLAKRAAQQFAVIPAPAAAQMPPIDAIEAQLDKLRTTLSELHKAIGTVVGTRAALITQRTKAAMPVGIPEDVSETLLRAEAELADLEREAVPQTEAPKAGDPRRVVFLTDRMHKLTNHLPTKGCVLDDSVPCKTSAFDFQERIKAIRAEIGDVTPDAPTVSPLTGLRQQIDDLRARQDRREFALKSEQARGQTLVILDAELSALPSTESQEGEIEALKARIDKGVQLLRDARDYFKAVEQHLSSVAQQKTFGEDVTRLEQLCELLGPNGARVAALKSALGRLQDAVNPYTKAFGWAITFSVEPWQVFANNRPVETYSRSERYRIGVAVQLAIAVISGLNFAIVDEVDMLDLTNRDVLTKMLLKAPLEQIIVLSTREPGQPLPKVPGLAVYRLSTENGQTVIAERGAA